MVVEPADDLAGGKKAGDRGSRHVLDGGVVGDLEAAKGEGDPGRHPVGLIGRGVEALRPIALVEREAPGAQPVMDIRVEWHIGPRRRVERAHGVEKTLRVDALQPLG